MSSHQQQNFTMGRRKTDLIFNNPQLSAGGYTLFAPQTSKGKVYLIDEQGETVHEWQLPVRVGRDAVILPNGNLGYNGSHNTSANLYPAWDIWHGGDFYEVTPDNEIVWHYEDIYHHHDAQWLENGNLLYTAASPLPADIAAKVIGGDPRKDGADGIIQSDIVKEVNRQGEVVWEWKVWEHLDPQDFPIHDIFDRRHWPMINGLSETKDGLVLMSLRTTSGVIAVSKTTGEVVWHVGPDIVAQQHTPIELENGNVLVFDNGNLRKGSTSPYSTALEFNPQTKTVEWLYKDSFPSAFFSPFMGSAQRLENGNTFICESAFGRLFEVTSQGEIVWEYVIPYFNEYPKSLEHIIPGKHNSLFRAHRYDKKQLKWLNNQ